MLIKWKICSLEIILSTADYMSSTLYTFSVLSRYITQLTLTREGTRELWSIPNQTGAIVENETEWWNGGSGRRLPLVWSRAPNGPITRSSLFHHRAFPFPRNSRATANARGNPPTFYTTSQAPERLLRVAGVVVLAVFSPQVDTRSRSFIHLHIVISLPVGLFSRHIRVIRGRRRTANFANYFQERCDH